MVLFVLCFVRLVPFMCVFKVYKAYKLNYLDDRNISFYQQFEILYKFRVKSLILNFFFCPVYHFKLCEPILRTLTLDLVFEK